MVGGDHTPVGSKLPVKDKEGNGEEAVDKSSGRRRKLYQSNAFFSQVWFQCRNN